MTSIQSVSYNVRHHERDDESNKTQKRQAWKTDELDAIEQMIEMNSDSLDYVREQIKERIQNHADFFHYGLSSRLRSQADVEVPSQFDKWLFQFSKDNLQWLSTVPTEDNFPIYATMVSMISAPEEQINNQALGTQAANNFKAELRASTAHISLLYSLRGRLKDSIQKFGYAAEAANERLDPALHTLAQYSRLSDKRLSLVRDDIGLGEFIISSLLNPGMQPSAMRILGQQSKAVSQNFEQLYAHALARISEYDANEEDKLTLNQVVGAVKRKLVLDNERTRKEQGVGEYMEGLLDELNVQFIRDNGIVKRVIIDGPDQSGLSQGEYDKFVGEIQHAMHAYMKHHKLEQDEDAEFIFKKDHRPRTMHPVALLGTGIIIGLVLLQQRYRQAKKEHGTSKLEHRQRFANQMGRHRIKQRLMAEAGVGKPAELYNSYRAVKGRKQWAAS